jgi:aminomuconate-semialdehyde/2-hydroxymuconate-6-semialdehyde dehydrogenase
MRHFPLYIGGQPVSTARTFDVFNPATGHVYAQAHEATADDVDRAVQAAKLAQPRWAALPMAQRVTLLHQLADAIEARFDDLLAAEIADTGKPASLAKTIDIPRAAANFRAFASIVSSHADPSHWTDTPDGRGALNYTSRRPVGPVGVICPWNLPLLLMTWKVAPALAAGNAVVVKPSEETPATATLLAEIFAQSKIPHGVYNVVHGFGPGSAGEAIATHPDLKAITFTGESNTGRAIMRAASPHLKKLSFELGGKNAAIVFADADLDAAIDGCARSSFTNTGQVCLCSERIYVHRSLFEPLLDGLIQRARALRPGDPWSQDTTLGPLISASHRQKVLSYYELARTEGATCHTGGQALELNNEIADGFWVAPTVWTGLDERARCVREEVFGPICHVQPFDDEDEAIALANSSDYGLCAAIWTRDLSRAHRVAAAMDVGIVWVNSWYLRDLRTPFGGAKASGLGREGGAWSLDFYSELKNVCVKL